MKHSKEFVEMTYAILQKNNPKAVLRVAFCDKAQEWVVQEKESNGHWLCLHNDQEDKK